eukprot:TRINITY_DN509_c0_g1_i2.p2 TRINITY_DN509_c0_g1~~TRINITY_DN509_c0_g1_i2.p2  ORF type:complete len:422 (+),score=130.88 TRINITY_DN509_c0_g1_i2:103-1368(+)
MMRPLAIISILVSCVAALGNYSSPFVNETMETGYIDVGRGEMFYWFFESRNKSDHMPVLLWLTGGPGCSSATALFFENGPYQIEKDGKTLKKNEYSWNEQAHTIFVDQPVGTGFSTNENYVVNEEQVGEDMMTFLEKFMDEHPKYAKNDFYISGESYAGHYVPAIGAYIARHSTKINLKGIAIGNGLVSPYYQYPAYADYAYEVGKIGEVHRFILSGALRVCQGLIYTHLWPLATMVCQFSLISVMGIPLFPRFNPYDITKECDVPPLCYDMGNIDTFLNNATIQQIIKTKVDEYNACDFVVRIFLIADWWFDFSYDVRYLLDDKKMKVMVYSGDLDFICNWRGGEEWTHKFDWSMKKQFNDMQYKNWTVTHPKWVKNPAQYKVAGNFSFIRVYDAGHMVPMDKPEYSLEMINEFMFGGIK